MCPTVLQSARRRGCSPSCVRREQEAAAGSWRLQSAHTATQSPLLNLNVPGATGKGAAPSCAERRSDSGGFRPCDGCHSGWTTTLGALLGKFLLLSSESSPSGPPLLISPKRLRTGFPGLCGMGESLESFRSWFSHLAASWARSPWLCLHVCKIGH